MVALRLYFCAADSALMDVLKVDPLTLVYSSKAFSYGGMNKYINVTVPCTSEGANFWCWFLVGL